ncbi:MAG: acyltransferase domain-containing protein, partial [Actinoallomurus sp.]
MPWVVSAHGDEGVRAQAAALAGRVAADPAISPADVGWSLITTRSRFEHRAVVVGEDRDRLLAGLWALAAGEPDPGVIPPAVAAAGTTVFLFSGQGSQRLGMGAGLYERFPAFATAFDEVCGLLDAHLEHPLREVVFTGVSGHDGLLDHTTYAQAGLFAVHVALSRLLASLGIEPDVVIGHSIGEIAAAYVAGVFDLADACRLVAARATLMGRLPAGGAMAAIQARADELADDIDGPAGRVALAALNTPDSTVISGPAELVSEVSAAWAERGRKTKALAVSHAFHSPLMDPILEEFTRAIGDLTYHRPAVPLISNLTGLPADEEIATPDYWARHIRRPVLFAPAIAHIASEAGVLLELGPDPVLATAAQYTLDHLDGMRDDPTADPTADRHAPLVLSALTGKQPETQALCHTLARLDTAGRPVDWTRWFAADPAPQVVDLPTYAFQRERYWLAPGGGIGDMGAAGLRRVEHASLPAAVALADGGLVLTGRISATGDHGWLADHQVLGTVLLPGAALVEWALRAADEAGCGGVEELVLQAPLVLPESAGVRVQVVAGAAGADGRREVWVHSRPDEDDGPLGDAPWVCHATGMLAPESAESAESVEGLGEKWPPPGAQPVDLDGFYERVAASGYGYGPAFRGLRAVWRDGADVLAEITLPEAAGDPTGFGVHPALLDAALHPWLLIGEPGDDGRVWLPFAWNGVSLWAAEATTVRVRLTPDEGDEQGERGVRVTVADVTGATVLSVDSVVTRPADIDRLTAKAERGADGQFVLEWTPLPAGAAGLDPASPDPGEPGWAVLGKDEFGLAGTTACHPDLDALAAAIDAGTPVPSTVLTCVRAASRTDAGDGLSAAEGVLALVQGWLAEPRLTDARLVLVTRG